RPKGHRFTLVFRRCTRQHGRPARPPDGLSTQPRYPWRPSMTEDEAKTKWCPFVRARKSVESAEETQVFPVSYNRLVIERAQEGVIEVVNMPVSALCIGSPCMAWRWLQPAQPNRS